MMVHRAGRRAGNRARGLWFMDISAREMDADTEHETGEGEAGGGDQRVSAARGQA